MYNQISSSNNFLGKPFLGEKYVEGRKKERKKKKEEERRIMPSLVATTSTPARKPFVRTHYVRTNCTELYISLSKWLFAATPKSADSLISRFSQMSVVAGWPCL